MKKYENQGLVLIDKRTKHTDTKRYDVVVSSVFESVKAFSLSEEELNVVTKALDILEKRRWGLTK